MDSENKTVELYDASELSRLKRRAGLLIAAACIIGAAALAACVVFCVSATVRTAQVSLLRAIVVSVVGGWAVITIRVFFIADTKAAIRHVEAMLNEKREEAVGCFTLTGERVFIKRGVTMLNAATNDPDGQRGRRLWIWDKKKRAFENLKTVKAYTVYGFIVACEVENEKG